MVKKVACPWCGGGGGFIEVILDDGTGPWERCGFCQGTGKMPKTKLYYQCLGLMSSLKRSKIKLRTNLRRVKHDTTIARSEK